MDRFGKMQSWVMLSKILLHLLWQFIWLAGAERFELPTPGFGDRCSTNWTTPLKLGWRCGRDLNPRPPAWQADILTNWTTAPSIWYSPSGFWVPGDYLLSHRETPHYHRRYDVSLLSSAWSQVGPSRYCRQTNSLWHCLQMLFVISSIVKSMTTWIIP